MPRTGRYPYLHMTVHYLQALVQRITVFTVFKEVVIAIAKTPNAHAKKKKKEWQVTIEKRLVSQNP